MSKYDRILCNHCGVEMAHSVKSAETVSEHGPEWSAQTMHQVLLCCTCSTGTYRKRVWFSEWQDAAPHASPVYEDTYYPPRLNRNLPKWLEKVPEKLQEVLRESYAALQHDLRYIATIGCRTALDIATVNKIGDCGGFEKKLAELVEQKHISPDDSQLMKVVIDSGDAAAHRGFRPEPKHIQSIFDIAEKLLFILYVKAIEDKEFLNQAKEIGRKVPPRRTQNR